MYEYEEEHDSSWSFAIGLFVGAIAGAVAASVLTPRSGQQNREFVRERGLVLKDRVADSTHAVTDTVRGTTHSAVDTVRGTTHSVVSTVREVTDTAVTRASETAEIVREKASVAAEKVSETTHVAVEKIQHAAEVATEKAHDVAEVATEKARSLTGRADEMEIPAASTSTAELASEASYDAEDARPVVSESSAGTSTLLDTVDESWREATEDAGESRDTATTTSFESLSSEEPAVARTDESSSVVGEPVMADDTSPLAADKSPSGLDRGALSTLSSLDTFEPTMPSVGPVSTTGDTETRAEAREASAELASDEQFEVAEGDPRESSEGSDRTV